jgi:uncharacterized protein
MRTATRHSARLGVWIALIFLACRAWGAELQFPALSGRVVDQAGILSAATQSRLTEMLAGYEKTTGEQVVIVTLASLQGTPIENFGYQLGRAWGIGQKGKNTGALLIIAPKERAVRIEVGYGLEDRLTDAISRAIVERDIIPAFRKGDYDRGVIAGTTALIGALGGTSGPSVPAREERQQRSSDPGSALFLFVILFFMGLHLFGRRHRHWVGPSGGGMWSTGGRSHENFGGFSGGGGSFGGGGASGRW